MKSNKGFTLLEVIIGVAIIGIVSASILNMFSISIKVNKKAEEIDRANVLATTKIEKVKKNMTNEAKNYDGKTKENECIEEYYNKDWIKIDDKKQAKYIVKTVINRNRKVGDLTTYTPKTNDVNGNKLESRCRKYTIVVIGSEESLEPNEPSHNFEAYIIKNCYPSYYDSNKFYKMVQAEYEYEKNVYKQDDRKMALLTVAREFGIKNDVCRTNYDIQVRSVESLKGSVPLILDVEEAIDFDTYEVEVINASNLDLDIYIQRDNIKNKLNFVSKEGNLNLTYLDSEREKFFSGGISVSVTRCSDNHILANYTSQKYIPK